MRYDKVKNLIQSELVKHSNGLTWAELSNRLQLSYKTLCPEWTKQLELEIGLVRKRREGRAYIWTISPRGGKRA